MGDYRTPAVGDLGEVKRQLEDLKRQLREEGRASGTQTAQAVKKLTDLVNGLLAQTAISVTGNITAGGDVTASGTVRGDAGITSVGAYNLDVTGLAGGRRTAWLHDSGRLGQTVSSIVKKTDLSELPFSAADFLACMPYVFHYIAQLDIRNNPENPQYDPDYVVPWDVGFMAEHLIAQGLELFVFYNEDGSPGGINYAEFGAVAAIVIGRDHEERLQKLERGYGLNA